ncbi:MAG: GatB/YqeY domain-containing protein [Gammaproteobacteria bacterium]
MSQPLKERIQNDMKSAMRSKDTVRLGAIRLILAAIKQREIDERITLDDAQTLAILDKMLKQRRDSLDQYNIAGRQDLADKEAYEISVIETYLPPALSDEEIDAIIEKAIADSGATSPRDMGKVMGILKPLVQGRADMGSISGKVKNLLNN